MDPTKEILHTRSTVYIHCPCGMALCFGTKGRRNFTILADQTMSPETHVKAGLCPGCGIKHFREPFISRRRYE